MGSSILEMISDGDDFLNSLLTSKDNPKIGVSLNQASVLENKTFRAREPKQASPQRDRIERSSESKGFMSKSRRFKIKPGGFRLADQDKGLDRYSFKLQSLGTSIMDSVRK